jgi:hypothetical protein
MGWGEAASVLGVKIKNDATMTTISTPTRIIIFGFRDELFNKFIRSLAFVMDFPSQYKIKCQNSTYISYIIGS